MNIYLATDHAGFELKEAIKLFLELEKEEMINEMTKNGKAVHDIEIIDFGAYKYDETDDYPKYISAVSGALSSDFYIGKNESRAIIFGGSGEGEAIVAGKYKGLRAGVINTENIELIKLLREHNDANVLSIGARFVGLEFTKKAVKTFLFTKFESEDLKGKESRHQRRVSEIENMEEELGTNTKVSKEELEELKELESMKIAKLDN